MNRPVYEMADVIRTFAPAFEQQYGHTVSSAQRRALRDLVRCRTAALGGHVEACDACGQVRIAYNSCRNRHCPKCQGSARARWLERQAADLLPVRVLPRRLHAAQRHSAPWRCKTRRCCTASCSKPRRTACCELAANPKHLGAEIGFLAVSCIPGDRTLTPHPHVHCVVPGGGLSPDGQRWVSCRPGFFLPVRVLSRVFRGKFLAGLQRLHRARTAGARRHASGFGRATPVRALARRTASATDWVVYAKPPFGGPEQVLKYLARYTHRVAISNQRLVSVDDRTVSFHWKDYADDNAAKVMTLDGVEFLRRFLQHVLPSGFVRIRHFGLLANRHREEKLSRCRSLLNASATMDSSESLPVEGAEAAKAETSIGETGDAAEAGMRCPACGKGRMVIIEMTSPNLCHIAFARRGSW